jgi:hypothetical protein
MDPHRWWVLYPLITARRQVVFIREMGSMIVPPWLTDQEHEWSLMNLGLVDRAVDPKWTRILDSVLGGRMRASDRPAAATNASTNFNFPSFLSNRFNEYDIDGIRLATSRLYFDSSLDLKDCVESHPLAQPWILFLNNWNFLQSQYPNRVCLWAKFLVRHLEPEEWSMTQGREWIPQGWLTTCRNPQITTPEIVNYWHNYGQWNREELVRLIAPSINTKWFEHSCLFLFHGNGESILALHQLRISSMLQALPLVIHDNIASQRQIVSNFIHTHPDMAFILEIYDRKISRHAPCPIQLHDDDEKVLLSTQKDDDGEDEGPPCLETKDPFDVREQDAAEYLCKSLEDGYHTIQKELEREQQEKLLMEQQVKDREKRLKEDKRRALEVKEQYRRVQVEQKQSLETEFRNVLRQKMTSVIKIPKNEEQKNEQKNENQEKEEKEEKKIVKTKGDMTLSSKSKTKSRMVFPKVFDFDTLDFQILPEEEEFAISSPLGNHDFRLLTPRIRSVTSPQQSYTPPVTLQRDDNDDDKDDFILDPIETPMTTTTTAPSQQDLVLFNG